MRLFKKENVCLALALSALLAMAGREKVLFDTDIGGDPDDGLALVYLLKEPRCDLLGVTTVGGCPELAARIASALCRSLGRADVPVHAGCSLPILRGKNLVCGSDRQSHAYARQRQWEKERYEVANSAKKSRIIDEVMETTGVTRKYVINLLNGKIEYRERKGRGKTYDDETGPVLAAIWREAGCPCAPYFKAEVERWVDEYEHYVANIAPTVKSAILAMSDSTMGRMLKGLPRIKPGYTKCNSRSGRNNPLKAVIPCHSGEEIMACLVPPGDVQVDTFALGGGDPCDNFFWILDATDRKTQWTVLSPTWNRSQYTTLEALKRIERKFPFAFTSLHSDNGGEIINHHLAAFLGKSRPGLCLSRSRPRKCDDNAHVEEKNRSVGRELFGERRIDCPDLEADLICLCEEWSDFCNFFRPKKMLISKVKRDDGKGFTCKYDKPKTPYQRLLDEHVLSEEEERALMEYRASLHGIDLRHRLVKRLHRIIRRQEEYMAAKKQHDRIFLESAAADSSLRDAPSGTSSARALQMGGIDLRPKPLSKKHQHLQSTQYLTNRKRPAHLSGTRSI